MVYNISAAGGQVSVMEYPDPLVWWQLALSLLGCFGGAFAMGAVGLGGVIWVPMLLLLPGLPADVAIGTVFVGAVPSTWFDMGRWALAGHINWAAVIPLMACVAPASFCGALVVKHVPKTLLSIGVACISLYSGVSQLRLQWKKHKASAPPPPPPPPPAAPSAQPPQEKQPSPAPPRSPGGTPQRASDGTGVEMAGREGARTEAQLADRGPQAGDDPGDQPEAEPSNGAPAEPNGALESPPPPQATQPKTEAPPSATCPPKDPPSATSPPKDPPSAPPKPVDPVVPPEEQGFVGTSGRALLGCVGAVVGFASSITGTGGPLLFLPVVFALRPHMKPHAAIGVSKAYVVALVHAAAVGTLVFGHADVGLSGILCGVLIAGVIIGARVAIRVSPVRLKVATAVCLVVIGITILIRAIMDLA
eukprot:TRINITY_DN4634_c0_g1_i1.p1 TRINITY_DN4634_c0_g1~~TRINITY_DN4634_c0_g1_i1.p1  ORF type:complete len:457 (+),score=82.72 TRINITY_DN4634_c0_g1_i1:117-1373(+)